MAEYSLDTSLARETWQTLDAFTQGYVEAAMWTLTDTWYECDDCDFESRNPDVHSEVCSSCGGTIRERNHSADHLGLHNVSEEALREAIKDCAAFQESYRADLDEASDEDKSRDDAAHGHDFWLTRNGHGAGFWDHRVDRAIRDLYQDAKAAGHYALRAEAKTQ